MSFALNEVEATAKKAARGAGHPWGLAEEAGKATRWLCAQGLDGVAILSTALSRDPSAAACPLAEGAALSDRAAALAGQETLLAEVAAPAMVLPFAALVARQTGQCVTVECKGAWATTDGRRLRLSATFPAAPAPLRLLCGGDPGALDDLRPMATRATPDDVAWQTLERLAHRTYAPATEESRMRGAGAGLSDND
ncbi:DUF3726 domain-containing protein [Shimia sp.]|uniref:DUF3726 domain-containing protein n=1 Tax=Shimia sp. TaxID=1954381 RepID=UPI0035637973